MHLCPECGVVLMEGTRFCLQCGAPLPAAVCVAPSTAEEIPAVEPPLADTALTPPLPPSAGSMLGALEERAPVESPPASPAAPIPLPTSATPTRSEVPGADYAGLEEDFAAPHPVFSPDSTLALKISPSPMIAPREGVPLERARPKPGRDMVDIDDEVLNKSFQKPAIPAGTVPCRFCKAPLALESDFCEQCGAPVADAAPPGTVKPKTPAESLGGPPPTPAKSPRTFPAAADAPVAPPTPEMSAAQASADFPARAPEPQPGLVGRLRDLFKKD